jgi:hypothetical protein
VTTKSEESEREVIAGRNQALFRETNERLLEITESLGDAAGIYAIACECADVDCVERLEVPGAAYRSARQAPDRFIVAPGHIYPDVERVVDEGDGYTVVEKLGAANAVAEAYHRPH